MFSIRIVLGLTTSLNLYIEQLGVKRVFLHGNLDETIYMKQLEGIEVKGKEKLGCEIRKYLYRLKHAPRQ